MCQLGKYVAYMCGYRGELRTRQEGVLVCGNGKFQSVMDEIAASFHFGLLCHFLPWVQTNEKICEKGFNVIFGDYKKFRKRERDNTKKTTYI